MQIDGYTVEKVMQLSAAAFKIDEDNYYILELDVYISRWDYKMDELPRHIRGVYCILDASTGKQIMISDKLIKDPVLMVEYINNRFDR